MEEFKGTKDEWIISDEWITTHRQDFAICKVFGENDRNIFISKDEYIANRDLIAAAPELLEALQMVTNELFQAIECINGLSSAKESDTIKKADKVINKALGL